MNATNFEDYLVIRKARKEYNCAICKNTIKKGEKYNDESTVQLCKTAKYCLSCSKIRYSKVLEN